MRPAVSLADLEAVMLKGRHGYCVGYNGQAVVDSKAQIVVAADVVAKSTDVEQLLAMFAEAEAMTGRQPRAGVADTGYFDMPQIAALATKGIDLYVPDRRAKQENGPERNPYHKAHFIYDESSDTYRCPTGRTLRFRMNTKWKGRPQRAYQAKDCRDCPHQQSGACTKAKARSLAVNGYEDEIARHAAKMKTQEAKDTLKKRSTTVEPVFGVMREHLGLVRFLLRGLENVKAEWYLTCTAHNLRKLWKYWWRPRRLGLASE